MPAVPGARRTLALRCRAGVHARRGGRGRRPGKVLARQGAAPLSRLTPTAPLAGEPFGWKPFAKPPLQGEVDAPKGADGGVHCRLAAEISCKIRQDIAPPPQGTMLASSRNLAAAQTPGSARLRSPLQGSLLGGSRLRSLPCKGRWMRRSAQTEGCIASWRQRYPAKPGRALPRKPCGAASLKTAGEIVRPTLRSRAGDDR